MAERSALRILVVDDDPAMVRLAAAALTAHGFTDLEHVATGREALLAAARADVLLLDQNLPDLSGREVLLALRAWPDPPSVVMVTAHGSETFAADALRAGAEDYLVKDASLLGDAAGGRRAGPADAVPAGGARNRRAGTAPRGAARGRRRNDGDAPPRNQQPADGGLGGTGAAARRERAAERHAAPVARHHSRDAGADSGDGQAGGRTSAGCHSGVHPGSPDDRPAGRRLGGPAFARARAGAGAGGGHRAGAGIPPAPRRIHGAAAGGTRRPSCRPPRGST